VVVPYRYQDHYFLGYAMDHHCTKVRVKPPEERKHQVFLLAKYYSYFSALVDDPMMKWEPDIWQILGKETGLDILSVAVDNTDGKVDLPSGIKSLGRLTREDFNEEVSSSLALVGVGHPLLSPSPIAGLCLGVPFIHPYNKTMVPDIDKVKPFDGTFGFQHPGLVDLAPPYVYHVPIGDVGELVKAVKAAQQNPLLETSLPEDYLMRSLMKRVKMLVEDTDWEKLAWEEGRLNGTSSP